MEISPRQTPYPEVLSGGDDAKAFTWSSLEMSVYLLRVQVHDRQAEICLPEQFVPQMFGEHNGNANDISLHCIKRNAGATDCDSSHYRDLLKRRGTRVQRDVKAILQ